jgi:DNA-binding transcriptional MerR regulator
MLLPVHRQCQSYPHPTRLHLLLTVNTGKCILRFTMKHPVEHERGKKFVGLPEFAMVCERIMSDLDFEQARGTVTNVPDERTIRYYLAEGLIQPSDERQGTASVFGYLHLLQLVAIKKLQAEHLPIRKIRELVSGKNEQELETLVGVGALSGKKANESEAKRYLESLLAPSMSKLPGSNTRPAAARTASMSAADQKAGPAPAPEQTGAWQRLEIEPGLELHIRSDYTPPTTSARTKGLADRIRSAMNRYWRGK